jgi:hypothetical protein
VFGV